MAHQRGKREQGRCIPFITHKCQFLTWDSIGRSIREEVDHSDGSTLTHKA
jgi:hypothetical protein